jgi:hypothetical protein
LTRTAVQWALVLALAVVAVIYFVTPNRATEACETWIAEVWEEEGGSVLTAAACARDFPEAWLSLTCHESKLAIRYDLAYGAERSPDLDEEREVAFFIGDGAEMVPMGYQAMDGLFAGLVPAEGALARMLAEGEELTISDTDSFYPFRTYSLAGAGEAIAAIRADC